MKTHGHPPCLLDIVEEHFEELDFLWEQREGVIFAPDWTLDELAELEERAEAHLDGLRLAELHAVDLVRPALTGEETFAATAATFVLMETGERAFAAEVLDALERAETPELRDGIRIGLRHSQLGDEVGERLVALAGGDAVELALAAADVLAFQRIGFAGLRVDGLAAERAEDRVLALGVAGRRREFNDERVFGSALADAERDVRMAALRAAAFSGAPFVVGACRAASTGAAVAACEALEMLGTLGDEADLPLLIDAIGDERRGVAALSALGALGRVDCVPVLIAKMADESVAREAAAAFTRITGQAVEVIPVDAAGPSDDADQEGEELPLPDPSNAEAIWQSVREALVAGSRWQAGVLVDGWGRFVDDLPLAIRRDLYVGRTARRDGDAVGIELEALVRRQRAGTN